MLKVALTYSKPCNPVNKTARTKVKIRAINVCFFALTTTA